MTCEHCHDTGIVPTPSPARPVGQMRCECALADLRYPGFEPGFMFAGNCHQLVLRHMHGEPVWVDRGIADELEFVWSLGLRTSMSCEGGYGWIPLEGPRPLRRYVVLAPDEVLPLAAIARPWVRAVERHHHPHLGGYVLRG